ncbi:MAG: ADP-ribosylation factor-directed GTPase activating protein isoform b [Planctomycetota bacterium]
MFYASRPVFVPGSRHCPTRPVARLTAHAALLLLTLAGPGKLAAAAPPAASSGPAALCGRIDSVLAAARDTRRLDADVHGAWQAVHGILAFGQDLPIAHGGEVSPALDYLLGGGRMTGWILRPGQPGVVAVVEEGSTMGQGHPDQWLGYLSQCGVATEGDRLVGGLPLATKLVVGGRAYTLADLFAQARHDIRPGQECSWTLMALAAYLPPDATWEAGDGRRWTTEDVVRMEAESDIFSAACGGTHRLYGLAAAVKAYRAVHPAGPPAGSGWAAAEEVLADCIDRARRFQQPDGSFSVHFFERPAASPDVFATLGATGHVFEVLALVLDDESLAEPWVTRAAERLVTLLERTADLDVECGALYHAAHGLALYRHRICSPAADGAER